MRDLEPTVPPFKRADGWNDETVTMDFLGLGNKDKKDIKKQFEQRFGNKWRHYWSVYKDNGGNKRTLNKTWAEIEADYKASDLARKTVVGGIIQKGARGFKQFNLAPLRALFLLFIRMNVFNTASIFKLAKTRKNADYKAKVLKKWRQLGGNDSKFDNAVEAGYNKKPIFAKKMNVDFSKTSNFINADGTTKTLKIPSAMIASAPPLGASAGAILVPAGPGAAASAATGTAVGGIVAGLFTIVNAMNIPIGSGEGQPEGDDRPPTADELRRLEDEARQSEKDSKALSTTSKVVIGITAVVAIAGISFGIWKLNKK